MNGTYMSLFSLPFERSSEEGNKPQIIKIEYLFKLPYPFLRMGLNGERMAYRIQNP